MLYGGTVRYRSNTRNGAVTYRLSIPRSIGSIGASPNQLVMRGAFGLFRLHRSIAIGKS